MTSASPELSSQVVAFLFKPEELTRVFLLAMLLLFVGGVLIGARRTRLFVSSLRSARVRYVDQFARQRPADYLGRWASPEVALRPLAPIPAILVTVGIFGTFLGLGIAVQHAVPALASTSSPDAVREALSGLLRTVSFKFQASAWGIILSILFTAFNWILHEQVCVPRFEAVLDELEAQHLTTEQFLADSIEAALNKNLAGFQSDLFRGTVESMVAATNRLVGEIERMQVTVGTLGTTVDNSAERLQASSEKLGSVSEDIDKALREVSKTIGDRMTEASRQQTKQQREALDGLTHALQGSGQAQAERLLDGLRVMRDQVSHAMVELTQSLKRSNEFLGEANKQQQKALVNNADSLTKGLGAVESLLATSLDRQSRATAEMSGHVSTAMADFGTALKSLNEYQARNTGALQGLDGTQAKFSFQLDRLLELINVVQRDAAKASLSQAAERMSTRAARTVTESSTGSGSADDANDTPF